MYVCRMYVLQICAKVRQFSSYFITDYYRTLIGFKRTKNNFLQYNTYVNTQVFFFILWAISPCSYLHDDGSCLTYVSSTLRRKSS